MTDRYYNPGHPGSFGGLPIAERYFRRNVKDFLTRQVAYTLHSPIRYRFRRRQIFTKGIHHLSQADFVDMQSLVLHNDGIKYLLTYIDTFAKYAWVRHSCLDSDRSGTNHRSQRGSNRLLVVMMWLSKKCLESCDRCRINSVNSIRCQRGSSKSYVMCLHLSSHRWWTHRSHGASFPTRTNTQSFVRGSKSFLSTHLTSSHTDQSLTWTWSLK